jgi:hypothetical protein
VLRRCGEGVVFALPSPFLIEQSHRADFVDSLQKFRPPGAAEQLDTPTFFLPLLPQGEGRGEEARF